MRAGMISSLATAVAAALASPATAACPPAGWDEAALAQLRAAKFELPDARRRAALAQALPGCLDDPRPQLRDAVAFEALAAWMRAGLLPSAQIQSLRVALMRALTADDPSGFGRPFAALTLAKVARVDRLGPFVDAAQREAMLRAAVAYQRGVRDFDAVQGWRHGVAHGADLLLQLALNPALGREPLDAIVAAVTTQIAPPVEHFYIFGESERLARPTFYVAQRGLHDAAYWSAWAVALTSPAPLPSWDEAFKSQAGLARKHNTQAFVQVLYVMGRESGDEALRQRLGPGLLEALKALPRVWPHHGAAGH